MVKRILYPLLQFIAFLGLLFVGGNWDGVNLKSELEQMMKGNMHPHVLIPTVKIPMGSHILIANGLIYAAILLVVILLFEALRKRLKPWAGLSVLAFVLAVVIGLAAKMGLPPAN